MAADNTRKPASKEGTEALQLKLSLYPEVVESIETQLRSRLRDGGSPDSGETGTAQEALLFRL